MLNAQAKELIKATIPVLREHGVTLTRHFYQRMFSHNPELKSIFNQGNQQNGSQQQALAMAVLAYAEHIENPGVLQPVLTMVANKHASLGIRAEHYPIVGKHLLASIREVLGDAASDELIAAWAAAYGQLADILIAQEQAIYQQAANQEGGWTGWRSFRVQQKIAESEEITSFYLVPADGGTVPDYRPGQYISVRVMVPELGLMQPRQYSLSTAPGKGYLRISVKKEAGAAGFSEALSAPVTPEGMVSTVLHDQIAEGALVDVAPPMGDYFLHQDRDTPVVLISAGVGVTPKLSMLEYLAQAQPARSVQFIHACRHGGVHAFGSRVRELQQQHPALNSTIYYEMPRQQDVPERDYDRVGRIDLAAIADYVIQPQADYYVCGPKPFMQAQIASLKALGVDAGRIHMEAFGSGGVAA